MPRHPREGGAGPRRATGGGRRGRRVPRVGPRLVRQRRRSSRSTAGGPRSSPEPSASRTGEARAVRISRAWTRPPTRCSCSPSSATARRCWPAGRASSRCSRCGSPCFEHLVDIGRIAELQGIERRDGALWVGAGTTQARHRGAAPRSRPPCRCSPRRRRCIGHFQIRNRGTLGGSIAHADPAAEYPAVALALDASMEVVAPTGRRTHRGARLLRRALEHDHGARRAPRRRVVPDLGWAQRLRGRGVRAAPRRLRDRGRRDRRRARRRRPDPALRDRPDRPRVDARARGRRRGRARGPADRRRRAGGGRSPGDGRPGVGRRPTCTAPRRTATRVGAAMVARAWTAASRRRSDG